MTAAVRPRRARYAAASAVVCAILLLTGAMRNLAHAAAAVRAFGSLPLGQIRGRLVDAASGQPIPSGSITVFRAADSAVVNGGTTRADGSFQIDGLADGRYTVRLRALGFTPVVRPDIVLSANHMAVDLGTITLSSVPAAIAGQVVTVQREDVALSPDRNSYSTKNMTTASGGTAVDVLRNVPSVEVDASNQVSLRGNQGVVVQINGRSSPLKGEQLGNFLAQLPASAVKNVEVSTNPSAKNDPEGSAGIINIVLNQDADIGWSGGRYRGDGHDGAGERLWKRGSSSRPAHGVSVVRRVPQSPGSGWTLGAHEFRDL